MISHALAALSLGGLLFIILPSCFQSSEASQSQKVSPEIIDRDQQTPPIGFGITSGFVIAGCISSSVKMKYTVINDEVNITDRLQGIVHQGKVLI
jgi:class 3 adenylate cyclase